MASDQMEKEENIRERKKTIDNEALNGYGLGPEVENPRTNMEKEKNGQKGKRPSTMRRIMATDLPRR